MKCTGAILCYFASMDGEDGNGLKLEKNWPVFSNLEMVSAESRQKLNTNSSLCNKYIHILSVGCQECCTCELLI